MNIKIAFLALLTLNTLNANTCTNKQMIEMIKKSISSEDIGKICEIKQDGIISDNHLLKGELAFIQYESGRYSEEGDIVDFKGFSIGSTKKYKNHLFSSIFKPLSYDVITRGRVISSEMNTFKFKYGYGYKVSTKKNIIIQPELVLTSVGIEHAKEVYSLMAVLRADIEYTKGNSLNFSYVVGGLRNINTISSMFSRYSEDTVPGMLSVETKHKLSDKLTINGLYEIYKNDTLEDVTTTETNIGVGVKYKISKKYLVNVMFESLSYDYSISHDYYGSNERKIETDRATFRVSYKF